MALAGRVLRWIAIAFVLLALLVAAVVLGIDTQPGRRFLADRLAGYTTASGITLRTSRIDGSLYGRMQLHDVEVSDTRGVFLQIPSLVVDWRPFAYLHKRIDVRELAAPLVVLRRNPVLKPTPTDPNAPTLPDIDLSIGRLALDRLDLKAPVTGQRHVVRLVGTAHIADGAARVAADAAALVGPHIAGGDRLHLRLDAVPDRDRFALDLRLAAPRGGLVDSYAHLGKPLLLTANGRGDWAQWRGRALALAGGAPLADLALTGQNGNISATGQLRPGLVLAGPVATLTAPALQVALRTRLAARTADTHLRLRSDALAIEGGGLLDFAHSRMAGVTLTAALLRPAAIAPNLAGRGIRLQATLDGPFTTPAVRYHLSAAQLAFGTTGVSHLDVRGQATIATDRIVVPVHATAAAVTGLAPSVGGLLTHLRLDGDLVYRNGRIAGDDLRLRSDRVDATALVLADLAAGRYTGALKGRINDYLVNGLGRVSVVTDARIVPGQNNGFALRGHVRLVSRQLLPAIAGQLGGQAIATAEVGYDLAGGATIRDLRIVSPNLRIDRGEGFYRPDGRIGFHASGRSRFYGPVVLDVSGTLAHPQARLRATQPDVGIGLTGLDTQLTAEGDGYRIRATAGSAYGPVDADVLVVPGASGNRFVVRSASIGGIRVTGTVAQTPAGPFAGTLALAGGGLTGQARLGAAGSVQRIDLALAAHSARLPGPVPVTIGGGTLTASLLLPPSGLSGSGHFGFTDVQASGLTLARAQGRFTYAAGNGRVQLAVAGNQAGAPFDLAAQAMLSPTRLVANIAGRVNGIALRLAAPAVAVRAGNDWLLQPTTLLLPQGRVVVSGRFGAVPMLHAVMTGLDLSILEPFKPGLGLGGVASGTIDYRGGGTVPRLRARVDVAGLTRTASLTVSDPLDIATLLTLDERGGEARALIKGKGAIVGRLLARLAPLGAGASLSDQLFAAPLSGGIRYNGPAELLWTLAAQPKQDLSGPIAIGADFGGRLAAPTVTGVVHANALRYENEQYDTVLTDIAVDGRFNRSRFELVRLAAKAGQGTVAASGTVGLDAAGGFPIDLSATLDRAKLAGGDDTNATVSGALHVTNGRSGGLIKGTLTVPQARYKIVREAAAAVPVLTGVHRRGDPPAPPAAPSPVPSNWALDVTIRADDRIFVSGMGLEAEWRSRLHVGGTSTSPSVTGTLEVVRGTYSFSGRRFDIDHGIVTFQGNPFNPALDIAATTTVEDVTATVAIGGYAQAPQISFTSTPTLPQDEVLSRILFGSSVTSLSPVQAIQLAAALNSLRSPGGGGLNPLGKLRSVAGIDRLRVLGADQTAGRGTSLAAGKYITNRVYVEVITDARGFTATQLEISLSRALSVLSQAGTFGGSNVAVRYKKTY